jgi:hypothetical protein
MATRITKAAMISTLHDELVDRYGGRPLAEYALAPQEIEINLN